MLKNYLLFNLVGVIYTALTYLIYLFFLFNNYSHNISYTLCYICGIGISFKLNSKLVFNFKKNNNPLLFYILLYVGIFFCSIIFLNILVNFFYISKTFAPLMVIFVSSLINYFILRKYSTR